MTKQIQNSTYIAGRVYIAGGFRAGLILVGPKWLQVVYLTDGDRAIVGRLERGDLRSVRPLPGYDDSPRRLARRILQGRKVADMTKGARTLLLRAKGLERRAEPC